MKKILCAAIMCGMILTGCGSASDLSRFDVVYNDALGKSFSFTQSKDSIEKIAGLGELTAGYDNRYAYDPEMYITYKSGYPVAVEIFSGWSIGGIENEMSYEDALSILGEPYYEDDSFKFFYVSSSGKIVDPTYGYEYSLCLHVPKNAVRFVYLIDKDYTAE